MMEKTRSLYCWLCVVVTLIGLSSCLNEDYYAPAIYGYEVEYLLCGGDTAAWDLVSLTVDGSRRSLSDCSDSIQFAFLNTDGDSILAYQVTTCVIPDSTFLGTMTATVAGDSAVNEYVFTDTLLFEDGTLDYLIVNEATSLYFRCTRYVSGEKWIYDFDRSDE